MNRREFLVKNLTLAAIAATAGMPAFAEEFESTSIISFLEIETIDLIKSIQFLSLPIGERGMVRPLKIDYSTEPKYMDIYHQFLKNMINGDIYKAKNIAESFFNVTNIIDIKTADTKQLRAKSLSNQCMLIVKMAFSEYRGAIEHINNMLKYTLIGKDLPYLLYIYPDVMTALHKNNFYQSASMLSRKAKNVYYKAYRPFFRGKNENIEARIEFNLIRMGAWETERSSSLMQKGVIQRMQIQNIAKVYTNIALNRIDAQKNGAKGIASFYGIEDAISYMEDASKFTLLHSERKRFLKSENGKIADILKRVNQKHFLLGDYYLYKAAIFLTEQQFDLAIKNALEAKKVYTAVFKKPNIKIIFALNIITKGYIHKDDAKNILKYSKETISVLEKMQNIKASPDYINALTTTAEAFYLSKDFDTAINYVKQAIEQAKEVYGVSSDEVKVLKKTLQFLEYEKEASSPF